MAPELVPGPSVTMPSTRVWVKQGLDSHRSAQVLLVPLGNIPPDVYSRYCEILRRFRCALSAAFAVFAAVAAPCCFQERWPYGDGDGLGSGRCRTNDIADYFVRGIVHCKRVLALLAREDGCII